MKKKIIFMVFCLMLFLIFTALSYGDIDPKYKARGHPWDHMLSPRASDDEAVQFEVSMFLVPFSLNTPLVISISKELSLNKRTSHPSPIPHSTKWIKNSRKAPTR
jgi:hypothetical protein